MELLISRFVNLSLSNLIGQFILCMIELLLIILLEVAWEVLITRGRAQRPSWVAKSCCTDCAGARTENLYIIPYIKLR